MSMPLQRINQIYNSFPEGQTMPRHEFIKEMQRLTSQNETNKDLQKIMARKRMATQKKQEINGAIENAR